MSTAAETSAGARKPFAAGAASFLATLGGYSTHTREAYRRDVDEFVTWLAASGLGAWREVDSAALRGYVAARHRAGAHGRSLARALSSLRALFRHLIERGEAASNPAEAVRAPRSERRLPRALDVDQMARLLAAEPAGDLELRDAAMFELMYSSGLRVSELTGLDLGDVDLAGGEARVLGKGSKQRLVPIGRLAA
ncbi:MAG: site-specific integrase, partial [Gammaproteobacteria bacterium]